MEPLEERRVLATAVLSGASATWSIDDTSITSNGLPSGGVCTSGPAGTGAAVNDAQLLGQGDAFDLAAMAWVNNVQVSGNLSVAGQTATFSPVSIAGLNVQMEYHALTSSPVLRVLVTLSNPTGGAITVPVQYASNFGSDGGTVLKTTSSGDASLTIGDRWAITDESPDGGGDPANTTVLYGPGSPAVTPSSISQTVFSCAGTEGILAGYNVTVPAGQTRSLMFFQKLNTTTSSAVAEAPAFFNANPTGDLIAGLSTTELAQIVNWQFQSAGLIYRTSIDPGSSPTAAGFEVYSTATNAWTTLNPYQTTAQMAVSPTGDLYARNEVTGFIQIYNPGSDTWSNVMAGPPVSPSAYGNLEVTSSGRFFFQSLGSNQLHYTTAPGVWTSVAMPAPLSTAGDYDAGTNQLFMAVQSSSEMYRVDASTLATTIYSNGALSTGEIKRGGEEFNGRWYSSWAWGTNQAYYFDISNPAAAQQAVTLSSTIDWPSMAADEAGGVIYLNNLGGNAPFWGWNPVTNVITTLPSPSIFLGNHSTLAIVLGQTDTGTTSVGLDGSGNLVITDIDGGDSDDQLSMRRVVVGPNTYLRTHDPNNELTAMGGSIQTDPNTVDTLISSVTGNIQVNTLGGNDNLIIDYTGGVFSQPIVFDGGSQTAAPGDGLAVKAAGLGVISRPNGGGANAFSGTVQVTGGGTIGYQNIEPLDIDGGGGAVSIFPAAGTDVLTVANGSNLTGAIVPIGTQASINISGTTGGGGFESHAVWNASTLTLDTASAPGVDAGGDSVTLMTVSGTGARAVTNLVVNTGVGVGDSIDVDAAVTFAGSVTLDSQRIDFNSGGVVSAVNVILDAGTGPITDGDGTADVVATNLTATATTGINLDTNVATMVSVANTGAGAITIDETDGVTLTSVTNTGGAITMTFGAGDVIAEHVHAGAAAVNMTLANGDLTSGPADPGVADIVGGAVSLNITAGGNNFGVSTLNRLEVDATTLLASVNNAGTNNAFLVDTAGGVTMNNSTINANAGNTYDLLVLGGSLLSSAAPANTRDIGAHEIILQVTGVGSTIGTAATPFEINASTTNPGGFVNAFTGGGIGEHIFISDLTDNFPVGNINAGAANVVLRSTTGAITDANAGINIVADSLALFALAGIGSSDALETRVSNLEARNDNGVAAANGSAIQIANAVGSLLTLTDVSPVFAGGGVDNAEGASTVTNASPVVVASDSISAGAVVITAGDLAAVGDDLTVNAGIVVQSTATSVTLNAGDNATIGAGAHLRAATTVTINIDAGNADPGTGATLLIDSTADIDAASADFNGAGDNDTFTFRPDDDATGNFPASPLTNTPITVNGLAPTTFPGDTLNLDIGGLTDPTLTVTGVNDGQWTFTNAASVTYTSIEDVNVTPAGLVCYGLVIDMNPTLGGLNGAAADTINVQRTPTDLEVRVNGSLVFTGNMAEIDHLTVLGSGDADTLEIQETASGLPVFCEPTDGPAGGHTSPTFTTLTGYDQAGATPVDIHFNGNAGADAMAVLLTTSHAVVYTSDAIDTSKSGNVGIGSGVPASHLFGTPQLGISFESLAPLTIVGAGGTLTADASSSPAGDVTSLTIADAPGVGTTSITPNAGSTTFEPVTFSGFNGLIVRSGSGDDLIDLVSIDAAAPLTEIVLDGDNLTNTDDSLDTIRVQSTSGVVATVRMLGGQGNDLFEVLQLPAGTIDGIAGQVLVSPVAGPFVDEGIGNDTLVVSDIGDGSNDNVTITETTVEGLTGFAGAPDIDYRAIDVLDVTGTAGINVFDILLNPGSDLDAVSVRGASGNDTFLLDLNTGDDVTNVVAGLATVTLFGDAGGDTFGQTPTNAPAQGLGTPALPAPPAALPPPSFSPLVPFPGVNRGMIRPSQSTNIVIHGGLDNHPSALAPAFNATAGNAYGPNYDLLNLDMSDNRPLAQSDDSFVVVSTVSGIASTSDPDAGESFQTVNFNTIEAINLVDQNLLTRTAMGDLYVRTTEYADLVQFSRTSTANLYRTRINTLFFNLMATTKTVVYGRGGNDTIQQTNVTLPAEFYGEEGNDYLSGYYGDDLLVGGPGADRLLGSSGNNQLWGDNLAEQDLNVGGNDQLSGGAGIDLAYGGGGNDIISLAGANDYAYGGWGNDSIDGQDGDDRLYGGEGDDTISGSTGNDLIAGNNGNDKLYGKDGHDVVIGGLGADTIAGENGDDLLIHGIATFDPAGAPPAGNDASLTVNDANDAAMLLLLADWVANRPNLLGLLITPDDGFLDNLTGGNGTDRVRRGSTPLDTGTWEALLP